jgi:hypothetical protein
VDQFGRLLAFLRRLEAANIHYRLRSFRDDSLCVDVVVPGQRWEIEFMEHCGIEIERFASTGDIASETELEVLFRDFSD